MKNPEFWYDCTKPWLEKILSPLSYLWKMGGKIRFIGKKPYIGSMPIIVIGNVTTGGTGKTPTAIFIANLFKDMGKNPVFITRGYGGSLKDPTMINDSLSYEETGDEPQILNYHAPVIVAKNRVEGVELAEKNGFDVVILDDGLQNHPCFYTPPTNFFNILVCDAKRGFGNGRIMPAGPLREEIETALKKVEIIFIIGDSYKEPPNILKTSDKILVQASKRPLLHGQSYKEQKIIAFAGLGNPDQFFEMLEKQGGIVLEKHIFPDHYPYTNSIIERLINDAQRSDALLVTTEKDMIRIDKKYYPYISPFLIDLFVDEKDKSLIIQKLRSFIA